ncbi:MAG: UDP-N-acetylmuramoyl-L-alanine--D-glutamate ligase, partial [Atribacterota bacterium]
KTGYAVARYLLNRGERVIATDDQVSWESIPDELKNHARFQFVPSSKLAGFELSAVEECIASPGFPPCHPLFTFLVAKGIPVVSEIEFAARFISFPLVGVTGSCGKSTTVALIGHILREAHFSVFVGGNFGTALVESLEAEERWDWGVVELSSFQLGRTTRARFHVAAFLNLFSNHLDYHQTHEEYFRAKQKIFENQRRDDVAVVNFTSPWWSTRLVKNLRAQIIPVTVSGKLKEGFYVWEDAIREAGVNDREILCLRQLSLPGRHNWENLLVAVAVSKAVGVREELIARAVESFRGLPHRLEWIGCVDGVHYFNDSKSTTPAATKVAVEAVRGPVVLILGGKAKVEDFSELTGVFTSGKVKEVIVYGASRFVVSRFLPKNLLPHLVCSLSEAVEVAKKLAQEGDTVLLSPACTSWDQYKSFEERGEHFRRLVYQVIP